jgi:hypothetical protein
VPGFPSARLISRIILATQNAENTREVRVRIRAAIRTGGISMPYARIANGDDEARAWRRADSGVGTSNSMARPIRS